jgi:antitoxin component of MazEF toxin-antitoxin module
MTKRLVQHGNSAARVIDKPILRLLGIDLNSELEVVTDGRSLILSPLKHKETESALLASLERVNKAHGRTLEKLAH